MMRAHTIAAGSGLAVALDESPGDVPLPEPAGRESHQMLTLDVEAARHDGDLELIIVEYQGFQPRSAQCQGGG